MQANVNLESSKKIKCEEEEPEEDAEEESQDIEDLVPAMEKKKLSHFEAVHHFSEKEKKDLSMQLLTWYESNHRPLPWRAEPGADHTQADRFNKYFFKKFKELFT